MSRYVDNFIPTPGHGYTGGITSMIGPGCRFEGGYLRPYFDKYDRPRVTVRSGRWTKHKGVKVHVRESFLVRDLAWNGKMPPMALNATALRKEDWIMLDTELVDAARSRQRAWDDLQKADTFGGFDGMKKMLLEHETMSDNYEAVVDFDALTDGNTDEPRFQLEGLPLPITHTDYWFSSRKLDISENSGTPLDSLAAEMAGVRIGEKTERITIGVDTGPTYGSPLITYGRTSQVYGYTNFTPRLTKTNVTVPTGTNPEATLNDVLACIEQLRTAKHYGPYMVYNSTDWDKYLDNDYARLGGNHTGMTLRDRLRSIEDIMDVRRLDFLTNTFTLLFVQMQKKTARAVIGLPLTNVQWPSSGGFRLNFKALQICVPQLRADYNGNCGILHATTA